MTVEISHPQSPPEPATAQPTATLTDAQQLFANVIGEGIAAEWIRQCRDDDHESETSERSPRIKRRMTRQRSRR